jgi:hypothetical protein
MTKKERTIKKYGLFPPIKAESDPWVIVCVNLMGPFTIRIPAKLHRAVMMARHISIGAYAKVELEMVIPVDVELNHRQAKVMFG